MHPGRLINVVALALLATLAGGCATVFRGTSQKIQVRTQPEQATVTVFDYRNQVLVQQQTPCTLNLKRGRGYFKSSQYRVVIEKPGYGTNTTHLVANVNGWYIGGNFVIGGLIGYLIVDPITGGMYHLSPDEITLNMVPRTGTPPPAVPAAAAAATVAPGSVAAAPASP